jgi:tol-pal system protein YbgF
MNAVRHDPVPAPVQVSRRLAPLALAAMLVAMPAAAQRASLGERVAALEQQAAGQQGNVELLNQITQLRDELRSLRAELEELKQAQEQQAQRARAQYVDLDSRIARLSGQAPAEGATPPPDAASGGAGSASTPPATDVEDATPAVYGDPGILDRGQDEQQAYLAAFDRLKSGDYVAAASAFQDFLGTWPSGAYAPNALYWLGESYYVTQNYPLAEEQFQALLDRYPTHDKAPGALLKVGLAQYGQRRMDAASGTLADVVARYPGTDAARIADERLRAIGLASGL